MTKNHSIETSLQDGYSFKIAAYFSGGMQYFQERSARFIGFGAVFVLTLIVLEYALQPLPEIYKFIISNFLMTILGLGPSIYTRKMFQDENPAFTHFFDGFIDIVPLGTLYMLQGLIFLIIAGILAQFLPVEEILTLAGEGYSSENMEEMASLMEDSVFEIFLISLFLLYLSISLRWSYMLVLFHRYSPLDALVTSFKLVNKKFWSHLGIAFLFGLIYMSGAVFLYIGLAFAIPIIGITNFISYADVTGIQKPGQDADKQNDDASFL